jgi:prophage regulatory protein
MIPPEEYLPSNGFLRERQILGDPLANPHMPALIPVSRSTWWRGINDGRFPAPVKLGPRITAWRADDIEALIRSFDIRGTCDE